MSGGPLNVRGLRALAEGWIATLKELQEMHKKRNEIDDLIKATDKKLGEFAIRLGDQVQIRDNKPLNIAVGESSIIRVEFDTGYALSPDRVRIKHERLEAEKSSS